MSAPPADRPVRVTERHVLAVLVIGIAALDLALLVTRPSSLAAESARLVLFALAAAVPLVALVGGVRGTIHPAATVLAALLVPVYGYTGLLLPWTQLSFRLAQQTIEALLAVPLLGEPLARAIFGGLTISAATLRTAFLVHYGLVAGSVAAVALAAKALVFGRRSPHAE